MAITKDHGVRVREAGVQNSRNFLSQSWRGRLTTGLLLSLCRFVWTLVYCVSMAMCSDSHKVSFTGGSDSKRFACNEGDPGSIPGLGISPRERNGNPIQYSCLENSMDRGAWQATVHGLQRVRHD